MQLKSERNNRYQSNQSRENQQQPGGAMSINDNMSISTNITSRTSRNDNDIIMSNIITSRPHHTSPTFPSSVHTNPSHQPSVQARPSHQSSVQPQSHYSSSIQAQPPTHQSLIQPPTPTHQSLIQPPTPTHQSLIQPPTPTHQSGYTAGLETMRNPIGNPSHGPPKGPKPTALTAFMPGTKEYYNQKIIICNYYEILQPAFATPLDMMITEDNRRFFTEIQTVAYSSSTLRRQANS